MNEGLGAFLILGWMATVHLGKMRDTLETALLRLWLGTVEGQYQPLFYITNTSIHLTFP